MTLVILLDIAGKVLGLLRTALADEPDLDTEATEAQLGLLETELVQYKLTAQELAHSRETRPG